MANRKQPNILFVFTDQHRLSGVSCYGDTPCRTPNIDALAQDGIRFETAYTVCPVCSPVRGTIMTGLYPHAHGICSNVHDLGCSVQEIRDRPELLSRRLQKAGYRCGYTGKWHLGTDRDKAFGGSNTPSLPRDVGFDGQNFPGHGGGGFTYPEYRQYLEENGFTHKVDRSHIASALDRPAGILTGPVESTVPYFLAEHTIGMIEEYAGSDEPFFIWHNFWGPHAPYYAPEEFYDMYRNIPLPEWPNFRWESGNIPGPHTVKRQPGAEKVEWAEWEEIIRHYYAFASLIDSQIGRVMDCLRRRGILENTLVIFGADHGETLGSHGGLIDKGWHHFEEIQRIPFIVRPPDGYAGGARQRGDTAPEWVSNADIFPTICEAAGAEFDSAAVHGTSCLPLLSEPDPAREEKTFVEFNGVNSLATTMATVRAGRIKYGMNISQQDELYDLDTDPYETQNLINDPGYADSLRNLRQELAGWMERTGYPGNALTIIKRNMGL